MEDVNYKIIRHIGIIRKNKSGWTKELNIISWNGGKPKYDIRDWDEEHVHMSRGITLTQEELKKLSELLLSEDKRNC